MWAACYEYGAKFDTLSIALSYRGTRWGGRLSLSYMSLVTPNFMVIVWKLRGNIILLLRAGLCDTMFTVSSTLI